MIMNKTFLRVAPFLLPLFVLFLWLINSVFIWIPEYLLPSPYHIIASAKHYVLSFSSIEPYAGRFLSDFLSSSSRVLAGFSLAVVLGVPLGLASGRSIIVNRLVSNSLNALRSIPGITWLPLAMVWFGIGDKTSIFLITMASFFPIFLNTHSGASKFEEKLYYAGAMLGVSKVQGVIYILLPACVPYIVPGLRLGLSTAWAYVVLGEITGVPNGLGALIMDARMLGRLDMVIVGMLFIAVIGKIYDVVLLTILKTLFKSVKRMI